MQAWLSGQHGEAWPHKARQPATGSLNAGKKHRYMRQTQGRRHCFTHYGASISSTLPATPAYQIFLSINVGCGYQNVTAVDHQRSSAALPLAAAVVAALQSFINCWWSMVWLLRLPHLPHLLTTVALLCWHVVAGQYQPHTGRLVNQAPALCSRNGLQICCFGWKPVIP